MSELAKSPDREFDAYAEDYDAALEQGLSLTGENKDFFARQRVFWLARCLADVHEHALRILDFGCGTGSSVPLLLTLHPESAITGLDVSEKSLRVARRRHASARAAFALTQQFQPAGQFDLAFCNGVFHHIPKSQRRAAVEFVFRCLRKDGILAFWENNPWNPGTRFVMSRIPFDRDAIMLSSSESRRLLVGCGFKVIRTDFLFYFPRCLSFLRPVEKFLRQIPLGAQYQVLCRKE